VHRNLYIGGRLRAKIFFVKKA